MSMTEADWKALDRILAERHKQNIKEFDLGRKRLEHSTATLRCHKRTKCKGDVCSLHKRTNHHMRHMPQHWRGDRGIMERICEHGVGHPDPDDYRVLNGLDLGVHGCDGCCHDGPNPINPSFNES